MDKVKVFEGLLNKFETDEIVYAAHQFFMMQLNVG